MQRISASLAFLNFASRQRRLPASLCLRADAFEGLGLHPRLVRPKVLAELIGHDVPAKSDALIADLRLGPDGLDEHPRLVSALPTEPTVAGRRHHEAAFETRHSVPDRGGRNPKTRPPSLVVRPVHSGGVSAGAGPLLPSVVATPWQRIPARGLTGPHGRAKHEESVAMRRMERICARGAAGRGGEGAGPGRSDPRETRKR